MFQKDQMLYSSWTKAVFCSPQKELSWKRWLLVPFPVWTFTDLLKQKRGFFASALIYGEQRQNALNHYSKWLNRHKHTHTQTCWTETNSRHLKAKEDLFESYHTRNANPNTHWWIFIVLISFMLNQPLTSKPSKSSPQNVWFTLLSLVITYNYTTAVQTDSERSVHSK